VFVDLATHTGVDITDGTYRVTSTAPNSKPHVQVVFFPRKRDEQTSKRDSIEHVRSLEPRQLRPLCTRHAVRTDRDDPS
jgi:hypothetical protein